MANGQQLTERAAMAKAQKTMMVPEDLYRLMQAHEKTTGTTFTRMAVAAFLQAFCSDPNGPDPKWMEAAVALERGQVDVGDIGRLAAEEDAKTARATVQYKVEEAKQAGHAEDVVHNVMMVENARFGVQPKIALWSRWREIEQLRKRLGLADTVAAIIEYRKTRSTDFRAMGGVDPGSEDRLSDLSVFNQREPEGNDSK